MADIAVCSECNQEMDVTAAGPFNRVACPNCKAEVRVKVDLGNYFLQKRLAFGGMSVLFVALDQTLGREVALKVLNEEYSSDEVRTAQFEKEAELTALVSHPNVVKVYSVGRAFGRFYIAMELIAGESLEKLLSGGKALPEKEVLEIAMQVTSGLKAAKASGLIHRDIKPGNILVDQDGTAKIVDFGLSLVTQAGLARAQEVFATPYYAPPEALEAGVEDFRSDIYALGASLYHALAGEAPIETTSTNTKTLLDAKLHTPALRSVAPYVSQSTSDLVGRMMAFQKESRPSSYDEVKAGLTKALNGEGQVARLATTTAKKKGSSSSLAWVFALVIAALLTLGFFVMQGRKDSEEATTEEAAGPITKATGPSPELKISRIYEEARENLAEGNLNQAELNFLRLHRLEEVPQPTGLWSGLEAGLCALMDGRSGDARNIYQPLTDKIGRANLKPESLVALEDVLKDWSVRGPLTLPADCPADPELAFVEFAKMLRNLEQGERTLQPFLDSFIAQDFGAREDWMAVYQDWARDLAEDLRLLDKEEPDWEAAWSEEKLNQEIGALKKVGKQLRTSGRARFTVLSWVDWLESLKAEKDKPAWEK